MVANWTTMCKKNETEPLPYTRINSKSMKEKKNETLEHRVETIKHLGENRG